MKYMLMMHAPRGTGEYQVNAWSPDDFKAHIAFMQRLNRDLTASGELVGAEGLASPGEAKIVRAGKNGQPAVTDGPFAETKEQIGGFFLIDARDLNEAIQVASKFPSARFGSLEVRPVKELPGSDRLVGAL